jgi:flagella basal body P-ring formation protein FlgA
MEAQSHFSSERIIAAAEQFAKEHLQQELRVAYQNDIELQYVGSLTDQHFSQNNVSAKFDIVQQNGSSQSGQINVSVEFLYDNGRNELVLSSLPIAFRIRRWVSVFVAARKIQAESILQISDVKQERRLQNSVPAQAVIENVVGSRVRQTIMPGKVLTYKDVLSANAITRGESVTIVVRSGTIVVRARGRALSDATPGEEITVTRIGAKGVMQGLYAGDGLVEVLP